MTAKSKIIYVVGSVVIGITAMLIILFGLMLGGVLDFSGNKLVISSSSAEFVYNGEKQTDNGWQLVSGKLSKGNTIEAVVTGGQQDVGSSLNYVTVTVYNANGSDVTADYEIEYRPGTLTVLERPITITTGGVEKTYDGEELSCGEWEITKGSLVKGHEISLSLTAKITDAGEVENSAEAEISDGEKDVTANYSITYDAGVLKVNPIELYFETPTLSKIYDGEPLCSAPDDFYWTGGELLAGHSVVSMKVTASLTDVGEIENAVEIKIAAENGSDITRNYLAVSSGTLTVHGFGITISTASSEKVYDGEALTNPVWTLYEGTPLIAGHKITQVIMPASQTNAGSLPNEITQIIIVNAKGEDVTDNYEINYSIGSLVVLPRPVSIQSGSASKDYDGRPLTCNDWKFTSYYGTVSGQWAEVMISGTITEPGQRGNTIAQVIIWDGKGNDLTANYDITLDEGLLVVRGEGSSAGSGDLDESGNISGGSVNDGDDGEAVTALGVKTQSGGLVYLRLKSFGDYDGSKWSEAAEYPKTYAGYSFNYLTGYALESAGYSAETISISVYGSGYYLPYYMTVAGDYDPQKSDVYNSGSSSNYSLGYYPYDYLASPLGTALSSIEINDYNAFVHAHYTSVPQSTKAYLQSVIDAQGWKATDADLISKVAQYISSSAEYNLKYDRGLDGEADIVLSFLRDYKEGICQHYASAATLMFRQLSIPARYTIGYVAQTKAGEWVEVTTANAHAWVEIYLDNIGWIQLEVTGGSSAGGVFDYGTSDDGSGGGSGGSDTDDGQTKKSYTLKPVTEYYKYDGRTTFTHSGALQGLSELTMYGYTYNAVVSGSFKSPGKYSVQVSSFTIYDPSGKDVTGEYKFTFKEGTLQVYQYEITVSTGGGVWEYDGSAHSAPNCSISVGHLAEGHSLAYFYTASSRTLVGVSINSYEIKIVDAVGADVTYKYKINSDYGLLTVSAREITVTAGSAEAVYSGTPLTCSEYAFTSGSLAEGHRAEVVVSGSNNGKAGTAENKIQSVKIVDASGADVTANYKVTTVNGLLTVYPV